MAKNHKQMHAWLGALLLAWLALMFVACGGKPSITGKWEQVSGSTTASNVGSVWEFFDDGTVTLNLGSVLFPGNVAGKYGWPDNNHIKIEVALVPGFVYQFAMSGDEMTLTDSTSQTAAVFKRYKEFPLSPQNLAGSWQGGDPGNDCLRPLGDDSLPWQISFSSDGSISISYFQASLNGQFSTNGNRLHIAASGTRYGSPVKGEADCEATLTYARLALKNNQGEPAIYRRSTK